MAKEIEIIGGKHVHRVVSRGREYFYFQLHRATAHAGPRIRLYDPTSKEEKLRAYQLSCTGRTLDNPREVIRKVYTVAKNRCRACGTPFHLTVDILERMLIEQNFSCAVSGLPFEQGGYDGCHMKPFAISIDRIDPNGGYVASNVRLVCKITNFAMNQWGEGALEKLAVAVSTRTRARTTDCKT